MQSKRKHIIISGGGTGGHIFPAIAIASEIRRRMPDAEFLFIGARGKMEMEKVPQAGFQIKGLWISGLKRELSLENLAFPFKLISSLFCSWQIQRKFKPDLVIGVGGFASGPAVKIAAWRRVPVLIQEQNSFPGITNRLLAKHADCICVAYPGMERFFPIDKIVHTGNPIRKEVIQVENKRKVAAEKFGMDTSKTTVLVIGGSQGALSINKAIESNLELFRDLNLQLIWQTGPSYYPRAVNAASALNYRGIAVLDFISEMDLAYALAELVISRAGAIASAELAATGKAVIFVPLPTAAEDHQMKNAKSFEEKGAAIVVPNQDISGRLPQLLPELITNKGKLKSLANNIRALGVTNATDMICDEAMKLLDK
jgi:UDP-N-acetylglucosamine--N-acetylmuramyl-(pentapeptide) pyrophosphoryl-undecaprenol N-acetylglucosamine transferase